MGNQIEKMSNRVKPPVPPKSMESKNNFKAVEDFRFLGTFEGDSTNGLCIRGTYFPEEIVAMILSWVDPHELLKCSEVCKKWHSIIKSDVFWANIYQRKHPNATLKKLPWYVYYCAVASGYFDKNIIKNGNGQEGYNHWTIKKNYGDEFQIEDPPCGSDPLPLNVPEFNEKTSCFATSYYECNKLQEISFEDNRLMQWILSNHRPHIYVSEWVAGRFDCESVYHLWCKIFKAKSTVTEMSEDYQMQPLYEKQRTINLQGSTWSKVEIVLKDYPPGAARIVFQHEGRDTRFWKGHYGCKMAGGVMKILFDSIEP